MVATSWPAGRSVTVVAMEQDEKLLLGMDAELLEYRAEMVSHGVGAEVHLGGDGPDPFTAGETENDLPLALRKLVHSGNPQDVFACAPPGQTPSVPSFAPYAPQPPPAAPR